MKRFRIEFSPRWCDSIAALPAERAEVVRARVDALAALGPDVPRPARAERARKVRLGERAGAAYVQLELDLARRVLRGLEVIPLAE